jgi:hypothetical protein
LPDISKINALAIGSVAKVDGLAKASILDIDGVAVPAAWTPLLDTYGSAVAAYGVRLLRTAYTGVAMRIRRDSDDVEADVEFDTNNEVSLTSAISNASSGTYTDLADFVDHTGTPTDAYVVSWKDQSGNGRDAVQSTSGGSTLQPKIYYAAAATNPSVSAGLFQVNGKPSLTNQHVGASGGGFDEITGVSATQPYTWMLVGSVYPARGTGTYSQSGLPFLTLNNSVGIEAAGFVGGGSATLTTVLDSSQIVQGIFAAAADSSNIECYGRTNIAEETLTTTSTVSSTSVTYLMNRRATDTSEWIMSEWILWPSDQLASNKAAIRDAVNDYYSIF